MSGFQSSFRRHVMTVLATGTLVVTAQAPGQFAFDDPKDVFRPAITVRDCEVAVHMLELDEVQQSLLKALYEDYQTKFHSGPDNETPEKQKKSWRDEIDPNADPGEISRMASSRLQQRLEWNHALADRFMLDLKELLSENQATRWPAFERRLFRMRYLGNGRLSGEDLDLTTILREHLEPGRMTDLEPLLEEYEVHLDAAIRNRENFVKSAQEALLQAIESQNLAAALDVANRQVELRVAVRDVNEEYAVRIAEAIGGETGAEFRRKIREVTYARVYRVTPEERYFERAMKIEDLDPDVMVTIVNLQSRFLTELNAYNDRLVSIIRTHEPAALQNKIEQAANRMLGKSTARLENPTGPEFQARRDMGRRYLKQLEALLTPDQLAALRGHRR